MECIACSALRSFLDIALGFTAGLNVALLPGMNALFVSLVALWAIVQGIRLGLAQVSPAEIGKDFIYICAASLFLAASNADFVSYLFKTSLGFMGDLSGKALDLGIGNKAVASNTKGLSGLEDLVFTVQKGIEHVFTLASRIMSTAGVLTWSPLLYAGLIILPYFILFIMYVAQLAVMIFRVMMLSVFAPFMILGWGFNWGRGLITKGVSALVASLMVVFASTAAMSVILYAVGNMGFDQLANKDLDAFISLGNPQFLVIVIFGWTGASLMFEGTSIANSLSSTLLTNQAAGILTAGVTGTTAAVWGRAKSGTIKSGKWVFDGGVGRTKDALLSKFKGVNAGAKA